MVDEWRDLSRTPSLRARRLRRDRDTRFSIYLPPADRYEGRFFQHITPVPDSEFLAQEATGEAGPDRRSPSPAAAPSWRPTVAAASGQPGSAGRPHHRGLSGQCGRRPVLAGRGGRHVRRAPAVRVRLRRERWAATAPSVVPRTRPGIWDGFVPVRHRVADGHPEHVHRADARAAHPARPLRPDRRRRRTGWERRHVRGAHGGGARCPRPRSPAWASHRGHGSATAPWGCTPSRSCTAAWSRRTPPISRNSGPSPATWDTTHPPHCCVTASGRTSRSSPCSPGSKRVAAGHAPAGASRPGARRGVDTAWRGARRPGAAPGGRPAVGHVRSSTSVGPSSSCAPARRRGRGSACSP